MKLEANLILNINSYEKNAIDDSWRLIHSTLGPPPPGAVFTAFRAGENTPHYAAVPPPPQ